MQKPTLGICVGMQLLTAHSEEGNADLLNIIPVKTLKFSDGADYKVPHTGWNRVHAEAGQSPISKYSVRGALLLRTFILY
jgi:glutamine amidotransferase